MKKAVTILFLVFCYANAVAQQGIAFQHLNTSNGLSYLGVNDMCVDKKGNLWIATGNGLNMFNGKTVDRYFASEYPQLQNSNVIHVTCDSGNRVWVLTANGNVTMLDEKRQMHRVALYEKNLFIKTRWILNSQQGGIILFTDKGHYAFNSHKTEVSAVPKDSLTTNHFSLIPVKGFDTLQPKFYRQIFRYDDANYLFVQEDVFYKVNYKTRRVEKKYNIPYCTALIKWGTDELMLYDREANEVRILNLSSGTSKYPFKDLKDQSGKKVEAAFLFAEKINSNQYLFTTSYSGIYIYNSHTNKIYNYTHNISDPSSVSNDIQTTLAVGKEGWVFITCNPNGISYFNTNNFITNQSVFTDASGRGYDGYIAGIATKDNNTYYIGTAEGLLEWKRNTNETNFISYRDDKGNLLPKKAELYSIVIDKYDKIWATASENGIIVLDKNRKLVKHIKNGSEDKQHVKLSRVAYLLESPDGFIWACGANGLCRIDPQTFEVDNFKNSALNKFDSLLCSPILFTDKDNLWIATGQSGVFHYNFSTKKLDQYNTGNGLVHNGVFCINADASGNIYIGTRLGLNILFTDGRIKTLTQKDGLLIDRAEGLLLDKNNRMWIGNDIGLACYNPKDSSLVSFDERYGLSIYGFRVGSYFETPNGEFVFGTPRGLQSFHPDSLFNKKLKLNAHISKIETKTIASGITDNAVFRLLAYDNQATFYFGSVDFSQHIRTYYQYQLSGIDKDWIKVVDQNVVRYNSLPPGKYTFRLRISNNNKTWQDAGNEVTIIIAAPFYETWWFKLLGVLLAISIIFIVINYYRKKQLDKRSELETELVITYFASQINSHKKTDDLLWDIAKNCISKLHFEDCVIYLKDEKNMLVQKAAYGPKNPVDFTIHKPIEIPVGSGIVGTVAQTGKAELVGNTEEDSRYITDDEKRSSEIAVPIIIDEEVIGVIDSENKRKNFFTQKHLQVLSTIAALCANQVQKTNAEEEKQRATIELLKNKQKAVESRLQSLRLQMNPHFLFNALNSIQQMILANEDIVATKYLSKFSRLLRSILVQSDKESISLKEELEILNLYIELESIRFKESFQYKIICDDMIDTDEIRIPALLVQPFVENAIWHGLMHKEGERILKVEFTEENDFVKCTIEDNGIGRKKAAEMKTSSGQDKKHVSKGIEVSQERLKAMCTKDGREGNIKIIDLADDHGDDCGTRVEINFPIIN